MKDMIIESLNIGLPAEEVFDGKKTVTGICKKPVRGVRHLGPTGFEGDGVGDLKHHGGADKAVCVYSRDHYPYWAEVLGRELPQAAFGENLSVSNLNESDVCIGDVFRLGSAVVQVSQPRQPCRTLAARVGRKDFVKLVTDSGRTGFYLRVLKEGDVERRSPFVLTVRDPLGVTVAYANEIFNRDRVNCDGIRKVLRVAALSESWRRSFEELLGKCG